MILSKYITKNKESNDSVVFNYIDNVLNNGVKNERDNYINTLTKNEFIDRAPNLKIEDISLSIVSYISDNKLTNFHFIAVICNNNVYIKKFIANYLVSDNYCYINKNYSKDSIINLLIQYYNISEAVANDIYECINNL